MYNLELISSGRPEIGDSHHTNINANIPAMMLYYHEELASAGADNRKNKVATATKSATITKTNFTKRNLQIVFSRLCYLYRRYLQVDQN
jgi:hypothetical protein